MMFSFDSSAFENKKVFETRLMCPCCHMGFIHMDDEMDNRFVFPSERRQFIVPRSYPTCNNCNTKFEVVVDRTLKISIRKIKN